MSRSWGRILSVVAVAGLLPLASCVLAHPGNNGGGGNQQTTVTVSPSTATVSGANTQQFSASVVGPPNTSVTWNLNGSPANNTMTAAGQLDQTGLYTAPSSVPNPPTASITAISVANGTASNTATITITAPKVGISVTPTTASITVGGTQTFAATVTGTSNVGVGWYVNGILNGNSTVGTITATSTSTGSSAIYTAPQNAAGNTAVTIMAESTAINTITASANVTVTPIVLSILPATPVLLPVAGQQQFTASVTGTTNTSVSWQVNSIAGGNSTVGTIDSTGLYTAPTTIPSTVSSGPFQATITAISQANTNYSASALVNVHVTVSISPLADTIGQGANLLYTATVNGLPAGANTGVYWSAPTANTGAFIPVSDVSYLPSNQGIYIAPSLSQGVTSLSATITAQAQFDSEAAASASTTVSVVTNDPLGAISNFAPETSICPSAPDGTLGNASCYSMTVSCDDVANVPAYLKVNTPSANPPKGTVLFIVGSGGANLYDTQYSHGSTTVGNILSAGYTTVQISFGMPFDGGAPNGWLAGPGGVRRLACRFATVANWINSNPALINPNTTSTTPFCATGNAEGAGAIGYAVSEYGLNAIFKMIELTSGPVMTELDQGCNCSNGNSGPPNAPCNATPAPLCFASGQSTIDAAYSPSGLCSSGLIANNLLFRSDSINYQPGKGAIFPLPTTSLNQRFGLLDTGADEPQGWAWNRSVSQNNPTAQCESNAAQDLPSDLVSATDIANDIIGVNSGPPNNIPGCK